MGQIFLPENIAPIARASSTTLTLASTFSGSPTRVNIGGQQYAISGLTLNTATTGANGLDTGALGASQLWYVYAVANQSTFAMALVASQTAPASGPTMPTGYGTAYKVIGAFYTDGSSQISNLSNGVAVTGSAISEWVTFTPATSGLGTPTTNTALYRRVNDTIEVEGFIEAGTVTGSSIKIGLPTPLTIDSLKTTGNLKNQWGHLFATAGVSPIAIANNGSFNVAMYDSSDNASAFFAYRVATDASGNTFDALVAATSIIGNSAQLSFNFKFPITQWASNATLIASRIPYLF